MALRQMLFSTRSMLKVGIPEFLNGIGNGVKSHVAKLESEIGDFQKLLVIRALRLKKLGVPCKYRKLILKYTHKYRLGLWRPRAQPVKAYTCEYRTLDVLRFERRVLLACYSRPSPLFNF
ncbi:unnamed protein product [Malus baccata var. baccata]